RKACLAEEPVFYQSCSGGYCYYWMIITSIVVIITAFAEVFRIISFFIHEGMLSEEAGTFLSVNVTEMIDLYLVGLVLIIMSLGLYQLFIDPDVDLPEAGYPFI
ncbi:MAG TPA: YqhA family protein, partial [Methanoregula sp.]|nr:YqhA family protein [Methanoregula sp.]